MKDLIKALNIFLKYGDIKYPTNCDHDALYVCGYDKDKISKADIKELDGLGFFWDDEVEAFCSFRYGSC